MSTDVTRWPDTHGRWPWVAAAAAPTVTAYTWIRRDDIGDSWAFWLGVPALLWHQTEEWVLPGGFLPWFNRTVMHGTDEYPITRAMACRINVGLGWGVAVAAGIAGRRAPAVGSLNLGLLAGNAAMHVSQAISQRRYNPGLATAVALFVPLVSLGARRMSADVGAAVTRSGIAAGLLLSYATFRAVRHRARGPWSG